ncbi:MAG: GntR family transcriptional regulator [Actinoallomurus sp.]
MGSRLPATRSLAAELGVSRGVVTEAYQRLTEDGHVAGRGRADTVVVAAPPPVPAPPPARAGRPAGAVFTAAPGSDVFDAVRAAPARIDLSPGVPDLAAFPRTAWLRDRTRRAGRAADGRPGIRGPQRDARAAPGRREPARPQPRR